ncbi:type II secretion system F family protein [Halegenticoccus soli]|uniref:type II secretion system F family protein n=1 Tax=Halegenticoccus soli TaxID=1985678 RepID=UPI000C6E5198|nr:type II secretion system F family protein [Halegenticoccus soli]
MLSPVAFAPIATAVALCLLVLADRRDPRVRLATTRLALWLFGEHVAADETRVERGRRRLRAAAVPSTYRRFAARALLFGAAFGLAGGALGASLAAWLVVAGPDAASAAGEPVRGLVAPLAAVWSVVSDVVGESAARFVLLSCGGAALAVALALGAYRAHWASLRQRAAARRGRIESTLPRTVAFVYALSRSGVPLSAVLDTLAANRRAYGEAAEEFAVGVRETDLLGADVLTALRRTARRTPSDDLEEFAENLASVLESGRSVSAFLRSQYDQYREEAESQQEQYLELLAAFAEMYVTLLVAGPLFLVTVLVIVGLVLSSTLDLVRFVAYVGLPLASAGFLVYVDSVTGSLRGPGNAEGASATDSNRAGRTVASATDGGVALDDRRADPGRRADRKRLAAYDRTRTVRRWASDPLGSIRRRPAATFAATVPLGALWVALRADLVGATEPVDALAAIDGPAAAAGAVALGAFAVVYELEKRRLRAVEAAIPDFLDRLASVNEAGLTVVASVERVARSDLGALTPELRRARRDVAWGAEVGTALRRMDRRIGSRAVRRALTLVVHATRVSGDVAPVLRIAADEARADRRLADARRREMVTYLLVIYLAFLVFLGIVAALTVSFVPAIEAAQASAVEEAPSAVGSPLIGGADGADAGAYALALHHACLVQAVCSGLIAGQLGEGSVADGAKHAAVLLVAASVAFSLL